MQLLRSFIYLFILLLIINCWSSVCYLHTIVLFLTILKITIYKYTYVTQVRWALEEDVLDGTLLTPRLRTVRLRGGAKDMAMGFNTDRLENEFSVVSVR